MMVVLPRVNLPICFDPIANSIQASPTDWSLGDWGKDGGEEYCFFEFFCLMEWLS
jgi:hypothetical protein